MIIAQVLKNERLSKYNLPKRINTYHKTTNKPTIVIITNATLIDHILTSSLLNYDKDFNGIVKCGIYYIYIHIYIYMTYI